MANEYFDPGGRRAIKVQALFARVASRYDLLNDVQSFGVHRYWKKRLLRLATPQPGQRALDLCCGTGDIALAFARRGANVVGVDFSPAMLAIARSRVERLKGKAPGSPAPFAHPIPADLAPAPQLSAFGLQHLDFLEADALHLPFPDNAFDIVTVGYGLRNLADLDAGLREMQRVARPGGKLLSLDFGQPPNPLWRAVYFGYLQAFVPLLGLIFCGSASAYAYILESLTHYPGQEGVAAKMRSIGLADVRIINFLGGVMSINYAEKGK